MDPIPVPDDSKLIGGAAAGDNGALAALWERHRERLRQMIRLRLDRRLQSRVDPSDVLQEAYLDLAARLPDYARDRAMPIFLWLRLFTSQRLMQVHRRYLGTELRDAGREISIHHGAMPQASSASLAAQLLGHFTTPSQAAVKAERRLRLQQAINEMDPIDREIIALRHFRRADQRRGGRDPRTVQGHGQQAVRPRPDPPPGHPGGHVGLPGWGPDQISTLMGMGPSDVGPSMIMHRVESEAGEPPMAESDADLDPVEVLAEEFLGRCRRGERPEVEEYAAGHPELAAEIRRVFRALLTLEDLKPSASECTGGIAAAGAAPERLGDYRILRELGRGGMGVVYEAEQESLGRRVALKVMGAQGLRNPKQLLRFHREARATARLHHTHIVPVFGVGECEGMHYYVMQFIPGLGLDAVLEEIKRLQGPFPKDDAPARPGERGAPTTTELARSLMTGLFTPAPTLDLSEERLAPGQSTPSAAPARSSSLVLPGQSGRSAATDSAGWYPRSVALIGVQVAQALDFAHWQGILHRDIKPSNLLLDGQGTVWVTDFGLAKAVGGDDLTHSGEIVGTIRYMAPERFEGRCDARSDVYALGLTLYELLARRPAFEKSTTPSRSAG
jgi:RNA polymerase sigma-70 factor (subfamily 1)